jgi:hypothetical protein
MVNDKKNIKMTNEKKKDGIVPSGIPTAIET